MAGIKLVIFGGGAGGERNGSGGLARTLYSTSKILDMSVNDLATFHIHRKSNILNQLDSHAT